LRLEAHGQAKADLIPIFKEAFAALTEAPCTMHEDERIKERIDVLKKL
jgi:hypothetical protein